MTKRQRKIFQVTVVAIATLSLIATSVLSFILR